MNILPLIIVLGGTFALVLAAIWVGQEAYGPRAQIRRALLMADRITTGIATAIAIAALLVAVFAGFWQVVARFATETPSIWSEALVRTALIWMAFIGLAAAIRTGSLVSIDMAHRYSRGRIRRGIEAAVLAGNLSLMGVLFWFGWIMAERVKFQEMAGLEVSISWGYAALPIGAAFAVLGALGQFLDRQAEELEMAV
ncbi:TRAP transporter small permease [Sediminicoccus sp. KRV36]|uniref:TRAP transporter small permease n=1 Tax=Sediminicoccus sp. KRV36 TaxID=3133721 RepID=UPI00200ECF37|nr:TRAP transporter small permease [Sediminicoccus rosea]UPY39312.1 TRAP transporter small permease [Sediminicoccus rosea]